MFEEPVRRRGMASLTPLIDVVFLLLIFFMLTTSFLQTQSLSVVTPAPSAEDLPKDARVVEIWLLGNGTLAIDGKPVERATLTEALNTAIGERTDLTVSLPEGALNDREREVPTTLIVEADGFVWLGDRPTDAKFAGKLVEQYLSEEGTKRVAIKADADAPAEAVLELMEGLREAGVEQVTIMTERSGS